MSVAYSIMEHLKLKKTDDENYSQPVEIMNGQLAALAALMVIDEAKVYSMKLVADGIEYDFSGDEVTPEYKKILQAMSEAKEIDFSIDYHFLWRAGWQMYELVGPFALMDFFRDPGEEDVSNAFYCAWNNADCEEGPGKLVAFGRHNGKEYSGLVDFEQVPAIPEGKWEEQRSTVIIDTDESFDANAYPELLGICRELADMSIDSFLDVDDGLTFYLNNVTIDTAEQRARYEELVKKLMAVAPEDVEVYIDGPFLDPSGADARLMTIEHDGKDLIIKVAEV